MAKSHATGLKDWLGIELVFYYAAIIVAFSAFLIVANPLHRQEMITTAAA